MTPANGADGNGAFRILVVDDEEQVRRLLSAVLEADGYVCHEAATAAAACEALDRDRFALALCDVQLGDATGLQIAEYALGRPDATPVVMVSGLDDPTVANESFELGAYGYLVKPFSLNEIRITVANALRRRDLELQARRHRERLEHEVEARTADLSTALRDLRAAREEAIHRLARAIEFRDDETGEHIHRVSDGSALLAKRLDLAAEHVQLIRIASPLHDIGKLAIPDAILRKPGRLTPDERAVIETHAEIGYRMLAGSGEELLEAAALIAWTHHEHFDGNGYPRGIAGDEIPIEGRIVAVMDVFDALTSDRVYRPAFALEDALRIMRDGRGTQFDPVVLDAFLAGLESG